MRYLSVCSGIEAATVAWHPLGWTPAGFSEIDPFPRALLQHRFGAQAVDFDEHRYSPQSNVLPLFGDFTQIQEHHVGPVDLLVGGTPCQSFSVAGKRLGLDDPRGNLAIEFLALAKRVRARWLAWENVPGVLSSWSGDATGAPVDGDGKWTGDPGQAWEAELPETGDFHAFLELFRECGYRGCYRVLDAQFVRVDGLERAVPQRRRRVFVVGHLGDDSRAIPVLFDPESLRGNPAPRRQPGKGFARDTVPSLTGSSVGARRTGEGRGQDPVIAERLAFGGNNTTGPIDVATAVRAHGTQHGDFESETFISEAITFPEYLSGTAEVGEHDVSNSLQARNPTAVAFSCKDSGQDAADDVSPTLRSMGHDDSHPNGGGQMAVAFKAAHYTRGKDGAPSDTAFALSADADMGDQDNLVLAPVAFDETQLTHPANHSSPKPGDPCHPLAAGARPPAIAFAFQTRIARNDRGQPEDICPTLNGADAGETSDSRPVVAYESKSFTVSENSNGFAWEDDVAPTVQAHQPNPEANTFSGVTVAPTVEAIYGVNYANAQETNPDQALRALRDAVGEEAYSEWGTGVLAAFRSPEVLRSKMHGRSIRWARDDWNQLVDDPLPCPEDRAAWTVLALWEAGCVGRPPRGWKPSEQLAGELVAHLSQLPHQRASAARFLLGLWRTSEGLGLLRQALSALQEAWRSDDGVRARPTAEWAVRRLTPRECERLQGFPDDWTLIPYGSKTTIDEDQLAYLQATYPGMTLEQAERLAADAPRYKAIGNSMAVNVMRWIGMRIDFVDKLVGGKPE